MGRPWIWKNLKDMQGSEVGKLFEGDTTLEQESVMLEIENIML